VARNHPGADEVNGTRLLPDPSPESKPFWDACLEGRLIVQRCTSCGEVNWFPRALCRSCSSSSLSWEPASGKGTVYTFSVVSRTSEVGIATPYVLALVDLDEGPRLMTHVVDCPLDRLSIDMRVEVRFVRVADRTALPVFSPSEDFVSDTGHTPGGH
jgi:uncharacterized protein